MVSEWYPSGLNRRICFLACQSTAKVCCDTYYYFCEDEVSAKAVHVPVFMSLRLYGEYFELDGLYRGAPLPHT